MDCYKKRSQSGLAGKILFEKVGFQYESASSGLTSISFQVAPGEVLAIVGPSGSGKSTIIDLILKFYELTAGKIFLDGKDLRDYPNHVIREQIAVVSQDVVLWNRSIRDNLCYGLDSISENEILMAIQQAQLQNFIKELPHQLDTLVGDRGVRLSGGEKQRIAIARAILRNPNILLLDAWFLRLIYK